MSMTIPILVDQQDVEQFTSFLEGMERRTARQQLVPIMKQYLEPLVEKEKEYLGDHTVSGALSESLAARSGAGDRANTISVFSAPTATTKQLQATWGAQGRAQQKGWASRLKPKRGRRRVFYGPIVHQGHRIVKRNAAGELYDTGDKTAPVPFASQATDALAEQKSEALSEALLRHILGD